MTGPVVRDATADDAGACAAIYAPYVLGSAASFETEPPDAAEVGRRIASAQQDHAWLVAVQGDAPVGYAYATTWKPRTAYRWTCEVRVYGAGRAARPGPGSGPLRRPARPAGRAGLPDGGGRA